MSLHKLSNGSWIDLSTVTAITVAERQECWKDGPIHAARVIVAYGENFHHVLPCDDFKQAQEMADALAAHVNNATPKLPSPVEFNINDFVMVKLTDYGRQCLRENSFALPEEDKDGWSKWQAWVLMQELGKYLSWGCKQPFEMTMKVLVERGLTPRC